MLRNTDTIHQEHAIPSACRERFLPLDGVAARPVTARGIELAGVSDLTNGYVMGRPNPAFHIALYTESGKGILRTADNEMTLNPGDLLLAPKGIPYRYRASKHWRIVWFHINKQPFPLSLCVRRIPFQSCLHAVEGYLFERASGASALHRASIYASLIVDTLGEAILFDEGKDAELRARFTAVWREVHADLRVEWNAGGIAAMMHCSEAQCTRLCKRLYGKPPMHMVATFRMQRAEELLMNSDYPLDTVAEAVGYTDGFAFSAAFKRIRGVSPSDIRNRNKRNKKE